MSRNTLDFPIQRRQTLAFLSVAKQTAHVYLTARVDMSKVDLLRIHYAGLGTRIGYTAIVAAVCARVLGKFPDANASLLAGRSPKIYQFQSVTARVMIDGRTGGQRCVLTAAIPGAEQKDAIAIQAEMNAYAEADPQTSPRFAALRALQKCSPRVGASLMKRLTRSGAKRFQVLGSFSLTSVGRHDIECIHPLIANSVGFGMGRIAPTCVPRPEGVVVRPIMCLSMAFDHRVIDGALAAELLAAVRHELESIGVPATSATGAEHG